MNATASTIKVNNQSYGLPGSAFCGMPLFRASISSKPRLSYSQGLSQAGNNRCDAGSRTSVLYQCAQFDRLLGSTPVTITDFAEIVVWKEEPIGFYLVDMRCFAAWVGHQWVNDCDMSV